MKWFFYLDGNVIQLKARLQEGDSVGTGRATVEPGGEFHGISYATLRGARGGIVNVDDEGRGTLIRHQPQGATT